VFTPALPAQDPVRHWPDGTAEEATAGYVRLSMPANLTGLPALQVPCGLTEAGLPIGMQIIGKAWAEATILRTGKAYEQVAGPLPHPTLHPGGVGLSD
jgi:aspartyl-tRNA(Asn)/glutamyl-tRNA(Gln) amidotransferase subunit A